MRTVIRRHSAFRSGPGHIDTSSMQTAIEVACDTIRILVTVVQTSDVYQAQQKTFNHFLESAFSSLLLAIGHRKDTGEPSYFEELHMVMNLVRGLATKSWMMRKFCDKLERLKVVQAALKSRKRSTASFGSMQSSSKEPEASQSPADSPEVNTNDSDTSSTIAFTPILENLSSLHQGNSETIPCTNKHDINLLDIDPEAVYTAWIGTPQSGRARLATITTENEYRRTPGVSCPPEPAFLMDPRSYSESGGVSSGAEIAQGDNMDDLQYMFSADIQHFLEEQGNTFAF